MSAAAGHRACVLRGDDVVAATQGGAAAQCAAGDVIARVLPGTLVSGTVVLPESSGPDWLIVWSGSCGAEPFESHPATWGAPGWDAIRRACAALAPALEGTDRRLIVRPHANHVVSDLPSCRVFLEAHRAAGFGFALAPATMITDSMHDAVEDHLERLFAGLGETADIVLLDEPGGVANLPGAPACPAAVLARLVEEYVPAATPVVWGGA